MAQEQAHCVANIVSNSHLFIPNQSNSPFLNYGYQKLDLENLNPPLMPIIELFKSFTFKVQGQSHSSRSHSRYHILWTHIPFVPCWSAHPFLRYSYLKYWPWKSKVKIMGQVKIQSHNESRTSYRVPTKISEKSSMTFLWLFHAQIEISRHKIPIQIVCIFLWLIYQLME